MKLLIKKLLYEELLTERLMGFDDDVEMIYNRFFKNDYEKIMETGNLRGIDFKTHVFQSKELITPLANKVNNINPVLIKINMGNNFYNPKNNIISIGYPRLAYKFIMNNANGNIEEASKFLDYPQNKQILKEFASSTIKGSIHHELVHWADNILHNNHIDGYLDKTMENPLNIPTPINANYLEIQAQIHNIFQLKKEYKPFWDEFSFEDLISKSPVLTIVYKQLKGSIKQKWKRDIIVRMNREGLLGKNMR